MNSRLVKDAVTVSMTCSAHDLVTVAAVIVSANSDHAYVAVGAVRMSCGYLYRVKTVHMSDAYHDFVSFSLPRLWLCS